MYERARIELEAEYPRLKRELFFDSLAAYMAIVDVADALPLGGGLFFMLTPDDFDPRLAVYFTYASQQVVLRVVTIYDEED